MVKHLPCFYEGFRLDFLLGKTKNRETYRAVPIREDLDVVLKLIRRNIDAVFNQDEVCEQYSSVNQIEGVTSIIEVKETSKEVIQVSEYVPGINLEDTIKYGSLVKAERLQIVLKILKILSRAHKEGIFHGGLSLKNVIMKDGNTPVLTDFRFTGSQQLRDKKQQNEQKQKDLYDMGRIIEKMMLEKMHFDDLDIAVRDSVMRVLSGEYTDAVELYEDLTNPSSKPALKQRTRKNHKAKRFTFGI